MKKLKTAILLIILLISLIFVFTGCTLTVETTNNSVKASVDGDTTEKVDSILDWIKQRINRVVDVEKTNNSISTNI